MTDPEAFILGMAIVGLCCLFLLAIGAIDLLFTALMAAGERRRQRITERKYDRYLHGSH